MLGVDGGFRGLGVWGNRRLGGLGGLGFCESSASDTARFHNSFNTANPATGLQQWQSLNPKP